MSVIFSVLLTLLLVTPSYADFQFATGTFTLNAGTGNQEVNISPAFQPKVVIFYWAASTANATFSATGRPGIGAAVDQGTDANIALSIFVTDNVATTDTAVAKAVDASIKNLSAVTPAYNDSLAVTSFDTDGFTLDILTNTDANLHIIKYVALGGSDITNAYGGEFLGASDGTGNEAFTGVGFQGDLAFFFGMNTGTAGTTAAGGGPFNFGVANDTQQAVVSIWNRDAQTAGAHSESYISASKCYVMGNTTTTDNEASFVSFDADGFTLNYSKLTTIGRRFFAVVLAGTFRSHIGVQARPTSTGTQSYTTDFQPAGVLLAGTFATANDTELSQAHWVFGSGDGSASHGIWSADAAQVTSTDSNQYTSASNIYTQATNPSTVAAQASLSSMLSTGYQLNWGTADANARLFMHVALAGAATGRRPIMPILLQ
jgi:hypothetical protein